ncbi:ABC-type multidrug transport system ATPase subunit [Paenibacillus sp. DS2015]|uniref:ABC transporter ATP-binding protein n=1 Tax=Paenibacillus sp. DS2015 TaxID=3373917 RepID=UPI003D239C49
MEDLMKLEHVSKDFDHKQVLRDVTFSIGYKETIALLGANGSGKSTLLRIICGLMRPSSGKVHTTHAKETSISYVPERFPKLRLTPHEYLLSMGQIQGMRKDSINQRINELMEQFGLAEAVNRRMHNFSKGMLQKVNIMQAILTQPDLLVLDEPLSGLDVASQQDLRCLLQELKGLNISMILTSHESVLLEELADRVISLEEGRVVSNTLQVQQSYVIIQCRFPADRSTFELDQIRGVVKWEKLEGAHRLYVENEATDQALLTILNSGGSVISVNTMERKEWTASDLISVNGREKSLV